MQKQLMICAIMCGVYQTSAMTIHLPDPSTLRAELYLHDSKFSMLSDNDQGEILDLLSKNTEVAELSENEFTERVQRASGFYIKSLNHTLKMSLEQQKLLAAATLKDHPKVLEQILTNFKEPKTPQSNGKSLIQLPDSETLLSRLREYQELQDYANSLQPMIATVTGETVSLESFAKKLPIIFSNYREHLIALKKDCSKETLTQHHQWFIQLLLKDYDPRVLLSIFSIKN